MPAVANGSNDRETQVIACSSGVCWVGMTSTRCGGGPSAGLLSFDSTSFCTRSTVFKAPSNDPGALRPSRRSDNFLSIVD